MTGDLVPVSVPGADDLMAMQDGGPGRGVQRMSADYATPVTIAGSRSSKGRHMAVSMEGTSVVVSIANGLDTVSIALTRAETCALVAELVDCRYRMDGRSA